MPARPRSRFISLLNRLGYRRTLASFYNPGLLDHFRKVLESGHYDSVIIEYIWYGYLADAVDRTESAVYLDVHDIFHQRVEGYARFGRVPDKVVTREEELEVYRKFDCLIAIQRAEYDFLSGLFPGSVVLAMHPQRPNDELYRRRLMRAPQDEKLNLVYFASFGDLNLDAINWFVNEIWSGDLAERFVLNVYGEICDALRIDTPGVHLRGKVPRVDDVYRDADIAINPARFGSGLKIKTVEALAFGVPLVTTAVGAEGVENEPNEFFLRADSPEEFRRQILRLTDSVLRRSISERALAYVRDNLSHEKCFGQLRSAIEGGLCDRA